MPRRSCTSPQARRGPFQLDELGQLGPTVGAAGQHSQDGFGTVDGSREAARRAVDRRDQQPAAEFEVAGCPAHESLQLADMLHHFEQQKQIEKLVVAQRSLGFAGPVVDAHATLDRVQPRGGDVVGSACARWPTSAAPRRWVRWIGVRSRTSKGRATALAWASIDGTPTAPISFKGRLASSCATSSLSRSLALDWLSAGVSGTVHGWTAASLPSRRTA